jgi:hypothetical protein
VLAQAIFAQAPPATIAGAAALDPTASLHTHAPLCADPAAKSCPDGGFAYGPQKSPPGFWVVGFTTTVETPGRQHVQDLKVAGTPLEIVSVPTEATQPAAMAMLLRPRLDVVPSEADGGIANPQGGGHTDGRRPPLRW